MDILLFLSILAMVILFSGIIYTISKKKYGVTIGLTIILIAFIVLRFGIKTI